MCVVLRVCCVCRVSVCVQVCQSLFPGVALRPNKVSALRIRGPAEAKCVNVCAVQTHAL